jgi:ketosteroid isomerase-like protein
MSQAWGLRRKASCVETGAMSQENVDLVRSLGQIFGAGSIEALATIFDAEIEWHEDPSFPEAGVYRGIEAFTAYARQFTAEFERIDYEPREIIDGGDDQVANMRVRGKGKASGAEFEISGWWAITIRNRKVVRCFAYLDRDRALEAVGLSD